MKHLVFARWELEYDAPATRELYGKRSIGAPEACGCRPCLNFVAARSQLYPPRVLELFDQLGISSGREIEVFHNAMVEPGKHLYAGWFHFMGEIISGADACREIAVNTWTFDLEKVDEFFQLGFTSRVGLLDKSVVRMPVVQLEFRAFVPWLLGEPEPEY